MQRDNAHGDNSYTYCTRSLLTSVMLFRRQPRSGDVMEQKVGEVICKTHTVTAWSNRKSINFSASAKVQFVALNGWSSCTALKSWKKVFFKKKYRIKQRLLRKDFCKVFFSDAFCMVFSWDFEKCHHGNIVFVMVEPRTIRNILTMKREARRQRRDKDTFRWWVWQAPWQLSDQGGCFYCDQVRPPHDLTLKTAWGSWTGKFLIYEDDRTERERTRVSSLMSSLRVMPPCGRWEYALSQW